MRCSKARDYLSRDMDGLLPPDATAGLRDHVDKCRECQSFREDLVLGRRLMAASEPQLPDNFDWKLQLRLNQALQQRAGETAYPWQEEPASRRGAWLPAFGAATSIGLAAVLAFAVFLGPERSSAPMVATATGRSTPAVVSASALPSADNSTTDAVAVAGRADRRSLFGAPRGSSLYGSGIQRSVSTGSRAIPNGAAIDRGWSGDRIEDLRKIQQLRVQNEQLASQLLRSQLELRRLKAQLDTTGGRSLDTDVNR